MQSKCPIRRRSFRLLNAIHLLHRQGYQNLACYCSMSPSGFHWRLELRPFNELYIEDDGEISCPHESPYEKALHSSGANGNDYFGWDDAKSADARRLAELIKQRFPRLLEKCRGENFKYIGWFVYLLGFEEQEALPVFFREYNEPVQGKILTTLIGTKMIAPPHKKSNPKHGIDFLWATEPDLRPDWHTAYHPIVDSLNKTPIPYFPKYPSHTTDTIAHGAYWEGAIYYLKSVMNYPKESLYIQDRVDKSTRLNEFESIFNSEGQLSLFDAHMVRVALQLYCNEMDVSTTRECQHLLTHIESMNRDIPYRYPNPYLGGSNPLHLARLD